MNRTTTRIAATITFALGTAVSTSHANEITTPQYSGVNNVSFHQTQYDKAFAGNGFLVSVENKLYAVTVKHALFEAKTPEMNNVSLQPHVKEWRIHPKQTSSEYIVLGKLLNADKQEALDMKILQKDWLVFEVKENHSSLVPLKLRQSKVEAGEILTAYGCTYANQQSCQQDEYQGTFISNDKNNLRMKIENYELGKLRGLSGSPVLDKNQQVVGIVSNVLKSESGDGFDFAPANLSYLHQVLSSLN